MNKVIIEGNLHFIFVTSRYQEVFYGESKKEAEEIIRTKLTENGIESFHIECLGFIVLVSVRLNEGKSPRNIANIVRRAGKDVINMIKKYRPCGMQHLLMENYYVSTEMPSGTRILQFIEEEINR